MKSDYSAKAASVSKWERDEIYKKMKCLSLLPVQLEEKIKELNDEYDCVNDEATRCSKRYRSLLEKQTLIRKRAAEEKSMVSEQASKEIAQLQEKLSSELKDIDFGFVGRFFGNKKIHEIEGQITRVGIDRDRKCWEIDERVEKDIKNIHDQINEKIYKTNYYEGETSVDGGKYYAHKKHLALVTKAKIAALKKILAQEKQKEKVTELKVKAASSDKEIRLLAPAVRKKLMGQLHIMPTCPYCGQPLREDDLHADHIYPVSKGGRSLIKNMILICSSCNLKKKDKTLNQFISAYKLNRSKIEANLLLLNKDF